MDSEGYQRPLWSAPPARPGPVRVALDERLAAAAAAGIVPDAALVAVAVELADQLDSMARLLRRPDSKPYDRVPFTGLARAYTDLLPSLLPPLEAHDDALRDLAAALAADTDWSSNS